PPDSALLARIDRERVLARDAARRAHELPRLWKAPFMRPRTSRVTSVFGSGRKVNGVWRSRHYGLDLAGPKGAPVRASNRGVVTKDGARLIIDADVLIEDGRIKKIGRPAGRTAGRPTVIDCSGLVLLPGLIQAHIHLCQTLFRGLADDLPLEAWLAKRIWPLEAAHNSDSTYWSAMLGTAEPLLGGPTASPDMDKSPYTGAALQPLEAIGLHATPGQ